MSQPLISATTGNKIAIAIAIAILTALLGWLTNALLDMRSDSKMVVKDMEGLHETKGRMQRELDQLRIRMDTMYDLITRDVIVQEMVDDTKSNSERNNETRN